MRIAGVAQITRLGDQFWRFCFIGVGNTVSSLVAYEILQFFVSYQLAFTIPFFAGIVVAAYLNARFTMGTRLTLPRLVGFAVVYILTYFLGLGCLALLVDVLGVDQMIAPLGVLMVTVPSNFFGMRAVFLFRPSRDETS